MDLPYIGMRKTAEERASCMVSLRCLFDMQKKMSSGHLDTRNWNNTSSFISHYAEVNLPGFCLGIFIILVCTSFFSLWVVIFNLSNPNYAKDSDLINLGWNPGICTLKALHRILIQVFQGPLLRKQHASTFSISFSITHPFNSIYLSVHFGHLYFPMKPSMTSQTFNI